MSKAKPRVLLHGNCQGEWIFHALRRMPEINDAFELLFTFNFGERGADHPLNDPAFVPSCDWAVWQTASGQRAPEWLSQLRPGARQFRFPTLWLKMLWPTNAVDSRNRAEPDFPWGRFANGDRLILKFLAEGVPVEDMPRRYLESDLNKIVNLDRYREMTLAELRYIDKQSDVAMAPTIESLVTQRRLFATINHPTFLLLERISQAIASALLDRPAPQALAESELSTDYIGSEEVPLHPQVIEHYRIAWAKPGMRWRFRSAFLTIEEYVKANASFLAIPGTHSAQQAMARANQAVQLGQVAEARRILLQAANEFPSLVQFLQFLGLLELQQGRLLEAEKVYRYALSGHPAVAGLHSKLGIVLLRRQFPAEARASFEQALRLDPALAEARQYLAKFT